MQGHQGACLTQPPGKDRDSGRFLSRNQWMRSSKGEQLSVAEDRAGGERSTAMEGDP